MVTCVEKSLVVITWWGSQRKAGVNELSSVAFNLSFHIISHLTAFYLPNFCNQLWPIKKQKQTKLFFHQSLNTYNPKYFSDRIECRFYCSNLIIWVSGLVLLQCGIVMYWVSGFVLQQRRVVEYWASGLLTLCYYR